MDYLVVSGVSLAKVLYLLPAILLSSFFCVRMRYDHVLLHQCIHGCTQEGVVLDSEEAREALRRLFQRRVVADLAVLFRTLHTGSRMSVFRRLRELAYLTSFTDGGCVYAPRDSQVR